MIRTTLQRVYAATGRRTFSQSTARATESKQTPELAKKQAEKIRNEEKNKEQRPSPLTEEAKKKFEEINSKNAKK